MNVSQSSNNYEKFNEKLNESLDQNERLLTRISSENDGIIKLKRMDIEDEPTHKQTNTRNISNRYEDVRENNNSYNRGKYN